MNWYISVHLAGLGGRHRQWKIDKPFRIARKTAHHFESGDCILFSNCDLRLQPRVDETLSGNIGQIEHVILRVFAEALSFWFLGKKYPRWLVVRLVRFDRNNLTFGIAESCEPSSKDAAGVDIDGAVEEERLRKRCVSVDHESFAAIVGRPSCNGRVSRIHPSRRRSRRRERTSGRRLSRVHAWTL